MVNDGSWLRTGLPEGVRMEIPQLGAVLREYRAEHGLTQAELARMLNVDQSYVSKIERGNRSIRDASFLLRVAQLLDVPPSELGLSDELAMQRIEPAGGWRSEGGHGDAVAQSQHVWRSARRYLNHHRADLAALAVDLYPDSVSVDGTPLIAPTRWLPEEPVELDHLQLELSTEPSAYKVDGSEPEAHQLRPLRAPGMQYDRYTSAIRYLDRPSLFENRPSYRLLDVDWSAGAGRMRFGMATYFDKLDVSEAVGHELALHGQRAAGSGAKAPLLWSDLQFRSLIGDPFDLRRRAVLPAITTLTLRRRRTHGTASFLLHWRDPMKVATAAGLYDVIPAGEFQPSSVAAWDQVNDFDIWRNIVREYSEELLGSPEHDGSRSTPIDYEAWPLYRSLGQARADGKLRSFCLGVGLDALTLAATILTAVVIDDDVFDEIFGDAVPVNAEGITVFGEHGERNGIALNETNVKRLLTSEPMASPGAACLALAWRRRAVLLSP